jgi:prepilin-type N-terminal cleavage/methylation domain-containing protein
MSLPRLRRRLSSNRHGFTLIETIVAVTLVSLLLSALLPYFLGAVMRSTQPFAWMRSGLELTELMERLSAEYRLLMADATLAAPLELFRQHVENGNQSAGTPFFDDQYTVVTKYVEFDASGQETLSAGSPPACKVLKVSVTRQGRTLTALFSEYR